MSLHFIILQFSLFPVDHAVLSRTVQIELKGQKSDVHVENIHLLPSTSLHFVAFEAFWISPFLPLESRDVLALRSESSGTGARPGAGSGLGGNSIQKKRSFN